MKLKDKHLSVGIWSENYEALANWYENVLGFSPKEKMELPNDTYISFDFGSNDFFFIGKHNKIKGKSKDPYRIMIGFHVKSVTSIYMELKNKKVTFVALPFQSPTGDFWCMTIQDPEGNMLQFMGDK